MIYNEEMNYPGAPMGYVDSGWKQQGFSNPNPVESSGLYDNKMRNKWGTNEFNTASMGKGGQHDVPSPYYATQFWNEQPAPFHSAHQPIELHEQAKFIPGSGSYNMGNTVPITCSSDMGNQQWGRSEINQTTPWETDCTGHQRYRNHQDGVIGGVLTQQNNISSRSVGGMPMGQRMHNNGQWMDSGIGKFGDHSGTNRGNTANSAMFMAPPPPLGMMTSHRQFPPPPIPPMHAAPMHQQFAITTFSIPPNQMQQSAVGMSSMQINEDSMWQDPNGDLRKWQRDTGTSIWGDPAKQAGPIQRWQQFTAEEIATSSSKTVKNEENGWGDLPPLSGRTGTVSSGMQFQNQTTISEAANRPTPNNNNHTNNGWTSEQQTASVTNGTNGWNEQSQVNQQLPVSSINGANSYITPSNLPPNTLFHDAPGNNSTAIDPTVSTSIATASSTDEQRQSPVQQMKVSLADELSSIAPINGIGSIRQGGNDVGSLW